MRKIVRPIVVSVTSLALAFPLTVGGAAAAQTQSVPTTAAAQLQAAEDIVTLTPADRTAINTSLRAQGFAPLPQEVVGLKVDNDRVVAVNDEGEDVAYTPTRAPQVMPMNAVTDEIKRAVGACLGIDFFAAVGAWEAIESQVDNWQKAAKFVLRRVGAIGILLCGGGIFVEYVL